MPAQHPPIAPATHRSDLPLLLLVGSGDRRYREYILAAVSRHFRLWLLDSIEPTWQLPYVEGATQVDTRNPQALTTAATSLAQDLAAAGVFTYDEALVHSSAQLAQDLQLPGSP